MKNSRTIIIVVIVLILGVTGFLLLGKNNPKSSMANVPADWKSYSDAKQEVTFRFPEKFGGEYIHAVDWPPQVQILNEKWSCAEAGVETDRAGRTEKKIINGKEFCITRESEGAAGSTYTMYAYVFPFGKKTAIFTFSMQKVQCDNYDEPKKTECKNAQASFDVDSTLGSMAGSVKVL